MFFMLHVSATRCPPLSRTTPFGVPVVPDVYRMYSGSVAATGTHSAGCAPAMSSDQSRSRPGTRGARSSSRWRMMQRRGFAAAGGYVAVEGVVAGVDDAAREPPVERRSRAVENLIPASVPGDGFGGFRPKRLRRPAPARVCQILRVLHRRPPAPQPARYHRPVRVAGSQCSSALPSLKRHISNHVVV